MFQVIKKGTGESYTVYGVTRLDENDLLPYFLLYGYNTNSEWEWVSSKCFAPDEEEEY